MPVILAQIQCAFPQRLSHRTQAQLTLNVFENLNARPPGIWATLGLAAVHACRHVSDMQLRKEVVLVHKVTDGPYQAGCRGLRAGFQPQFHCPFGAVLVTNGKFRARSFQILL